MRQERFNTQPPEGGWIFRLFVEKNDERFNTQPPEGGWPSFIIKTTFTYGFNTQPPEGGWSSLGNLLSCISMFQHTAARRRLESKTLLLLPYPCFNTQPPEGGWDGLDLSADNETIVSTHSRPKAAGENQPGPAQSRHVSTHSRPKAAGVQP